MIRTLALVLSLCAGSAAAEMYPVLAEVTGVAASSALNIRAAPDAGAAIIGTLAPDATGIEVVAVADGWARINHGEATGHVALRHLRLAEGPPWTALEAPLACHGTEPFWSLDIDPVAGTATFRTPEPSGARAEPIAQRWPGQPWAQTAALALPEGLVVLRPAACSDGMSDRGFGIAIDIFLSEPAGGRHSGCCSLDIR